jgi:hypothetical protein
MGIQKELWLEYGRLIQQRFYQIHDDDLTAVPNSPAQRLVAVLTRIQLWLAVLFVFIIVTLTIILSDL